MLHPSGLEFHFIKTAHVDILGGAEDVDDDCDSQGGLSGCDCYCKECEEHAFELAGMKIAVENHKEHIDGVEHEFQRYEYRDHILAGNETVYACAKHQQGGQEVKYCGNFHISQDLTATGDYHATDYTCQ